jgi:ABC-2 type transporter
MFIAFFVMLIFLPMSGLFTPVDSMPDWAQKAAEANPVKHFVFIMRSVLVRGAGIETVGPTIVGLAVAGGGRARAGGAALPQVHRVSPATQRSMATAVSTGRMTEVRPVEGARSRAGAPARIRAPSALHQSRA